MKSHLDINEKRYEQPRWLTRVQHNAEDPSVEIHAQMYLYLYLYTSYDRTGLEVTSYGTGALPIKECTL